jgi:hypothetical protein
MLMLMEALKFLADLGAQARGATLLPIPGEPRKLLQVSDGEVTEISLPAPLRNHRVDSLEAFIDAARRWGGGLGEEDELSGAVFHNEAQITLVVNDSDRRDFVTMPLRKSQVFCTLEKLGAPMTHPAFIRLLRHDLLGTGAENLLPIVRRIDFTRNASGHSSRDHTSGSLGKAVESKVQGVSDIPEAFTLGVPVYKNAGLEHIANVVCTLEIDPDLASFKLCPAPDALDLAVRQTQRFIGEALESELGDTPVFYGSFQ